MNTRTTVEEILKDVIRLQEKHGIEDLRLFKSLISAEQYRRHYEKVLQYVPLGAKVFDWGCGGGHFSFGLSRLGYRPYAYGFYDFELRRLIPNGFEFRQGSFEDPITIPYSDGYFDAVVSVGVLEHVRETGGDELSSMRELRRILVPGGYFLCFHFPNRLSLIEKVTAHVGSVHNHAFKYDRQAIHELCRIGGFEILEVQRYGALPRNMWNQFPERWRKSSRLARGYNLLDELLRYPLSPICQNYLFVARRADVSLTSKDSASPSSFNPRRTANGVLRRMLRSRAGPQHRP